MTDLPFTDLLVDPNTWSMWVPRKEIEPKFSVAVDGGPGGGLALVIAAEEDPLACGCWRLPLSGLVIGNRYRIEAAFRAEEVEAPGKSVRAVLTCENKNGEQVYDHLDAMGGRAGWHRVGYVFEMAESVPELSLNLFLAWSRSGRVHWADVRLYDLTGAPVEERSARLAAVTGNPIKPGAPVDCLDFYTDRLDELAEGRPDMVCLPEFINVVGLPGPPADWAEPIPGPTSERLSEKARDYGMYIAASLMERQGDGIYNTGLLIDRTGGILGKYRKTHLTMAEGLLWGLAPGNDYPVFQTDFGTVAYMICYDGHYPEVPRTLALSGAEVILFSNMGDGREGGSLWEHVVRTRAVDNQVHIVAALNRGRSCVVSPKGAFLDIADGTPGATAVADCDLNTSMCDSTGRPIHRRYDQLRRADTFSGLARHLWDGV